MFIVRERQRERERETGSLRGREPGVLTEKTKLSPKRRESAWCLLAQF